MSSAEYTYWMAEFAIRDDEERARAAAAEEAAAAETT